MTNTTLVDVNFRVNIQTKRELKEFCKEKDLNYSEVCRRSLSKGFELHYKNRDNLIVLITQLKNKCTDCELISQIENLLKL